MKNKVCETLSLISVTTPLSMLLTAAVTVGAVSTANAQTVVKRLSDSDRYSQRYCVRHRHGDFWHSCSDTQHPVYDQPHYHSGLSAYYPSVSPEQAGGVYFGVKSGSMIIDSAQSDEGMPRGLLIGYGWLEYALEFETSSTSISAPSTEIAPVAEASGFDSGFTTTAVYGVRRIGDDIYTKMKVGLSRSSYDTDGEKQSDSGVSAGFGVGWRVGTILLEGEYTFIGSTAKFVSIGANVVF